MVARPAQIRRIARTLSTISFQSHSQLPPSLLTSTPLTSSSSSSSSSSPFPSQSSPSPPTPTGTTTRKYTDRKAFLYSYYTHLLDTSQLVLLFKHDNLTVSDLQRIRHAIASVPVPLPSNSTTLTASESPMPSVPVGATLTITRTGILRPASAHRPIASSLRPLLSKPTALLTTPTLSPTYLNRVLASIERVLKASKRPDSPAAGDSKGGSKSKNKSPLLELVAGILEGDKLMNAKEIGEISKIPELSTLHAQLVGLLESQTRGLVGVLNQARGGGLVRTLQGLEKDLQGDHQAKAD